MIKLAVFDWNGTLLSDTKLVVDGFNKELSHLNYPPVTIEHFRQVYQMPSVRLLKNLGVDEATFKKHRLKMTASFHAYYEPLAAKARTRQGTRQTLATLKQQGVTCVILSNHTMEGIYLQLERLKLGHFFDDVLANEGIGMNHFTGKHQRLKHYLAENDYKSDTGFIVGDSTEEIHIGQDLGLNSISITGGCTSAKRLRLANPDVVIHKVTDILEVIKEW